MPASQAACAGNCNKKDQNEGPPVRNREKYVLGGLFEKKNKNKTKTATVCNNVRLEHPRGVWLIFGHDAAGAVVF